MTDVYGPTPEEIGFDGDDPQRLVALGDAHTIHGGAAGLVPALKAYQRARELLSGAARADAEARAAAMLARLDLPPRPTFPPGAAPPAHPVSELVATLDHRAHPLARYAEAFRGFDRLATEVLGAGADSVVLRLEDGTVLHVTNKLLAPELGLRPFDLPMLERGALASAGGRRIHYFVQPEARTPVDERTLRAFADRLYEDGWSLADPSIHQLGDWRDEVWLLDPFAAGPKPKFDR